MTKYRIHETPDRRTLQYQKQERFLFFKYNVWRDVPIYCVDEYSDCDWLWTVNNRSFEKMEEFPKVWPNIEDYFEKEYNPKVLSTYKLKQETKTT